LRSASSLRSGLTPQAVRARVKAGRLHRRHAGVYSLSPSRPSAKAQWMAAVLACGPGAALSYRDAGAAHGLRSSSRQRIDVTSPRRTGQTRRGIQAHTSRTMTAADIVLVDGIPCTSIARTSLDLAAVLDRDGLHRVLERAVALRVFHLDEFEDVLRRNPTHAGARKLRAAIGSELPDSKRWLEDRFVRDCIPDGAPPYERNVIVAGHECDFAWPTLRINVETDGGSFHDTFAGERRDRPRDRKLALATWMVVRYGRQEIVEQPEEVRRELSALLAAGMEEAA
jgi:very-short-patch-repair endonuclease